MFEQKKKRRRDEEKRQLFHTLISYEALKIENLKKKKRLGIEEDES